MKILMRAGGVALGVMTGSTVGGLIGWTLGDLGGRSDPENVWFLSLVAGAAVGFAIAIAIVLRRARRMDWGVSALIGTVSGILAATVVVLFVAWQR